MCNSQWCNYLRDELSLKNFGLQGIHSARFAYLQKTRRHRIYIPFRENFIGSQGWRLPIGFVLVYRVILALYCLGWLLYASEFPDILINGIHIKQYAFLTMWTYLLLTVYFVLHCLLCVIYACYSSTGLWQAPSRDDHRRLFQELDVQPSLWGSRDYTPIPDSEFDDVSEIQTGRPMVSRFRRIVWVLYNIASAACIMVTIIFWTMLYPSMGKMSATELLLNFQLHAITSVLIIIETMVTAVPVRLLHFVYTLLYGIIYIVFSAIYYAVDHRHILYPDVLDWSKPGRTAVLIVVMALVGLPLIQLILFLIYKLRMYIYSRCNPE